MAPTPCAIGRTIQRPALMWAMMDGAIPANRLKSKPRSWSAAAQERGCSQRPGARFRCLKPPGCPGGFQLYVLRDRDFIANGEFSRIWHGQLYHHSSTIHVRSFNACGLE